MEQSSDVARLDLSGVSVLVVDDEEPIRKAFSKLLIGLGVRTILEAGNGLEAIEVLHAHGEQIRVILLDLRLPRMSGLELLRHLVNVHPHPVAVVMATAMATAYWTEDVEEHFYKESSEVVWPCRLP
jgi:CheY-like chemotaxis protein